MIGVLGLALTCASGLLLFYIARRRNGLNPPRWMGWAVTAHSTLTVFLVGILFGCALILLPFFHKDIAIPGLPELVMALGVMVATVVLWRLVDRIPRGAAPGA